MLHAAWLIAPGMIDQKLCIDAKQTVQQFFIVIISWLSNGAARDIAHRQHTMFLQLCRITAANPPEIGDGLMRPEFAPVADLVQHGDPGSILICRNMLRFDIHGDFGKIQIRTNPCCSSNPRFCKNLLHNLFRILPRRTACCLQIIRQVDKHLID